MDFYIMDPIAKNKVLAVEGKDEVRFFKVLLNKLGIRDVDIRDVIGRDLFIQKVPLLVKTSGFENVQVFAIIRDADKNAESAFKSVVEILRKSGLEAPKKMDSFTREKPRVGIFIMPGGGEKGMLEDLCLKTVKGSPTMKCVDKFCQCVRKLRESPKNMSKVKVQVFLSAMPKIANCLGVGAEKKYWDLDSTELLKIKGFLSNFR